MNISLKCQFPLLWIDVICAWYSQIVFQSQKQANPKLLTLVELALWNTWIRFIIQNRLFTINSKYVQQMVLKCTTWTVEACGCFFLVWSLKFVSTLCLLPVSTWHCLCAQRQPHKEMLFLFWCANADWPAESPTSTPPNTFGMSWNTDCEPLHHPTAIAIPAARSQHLLESLKPDEWGLLTAADWGLKHCSFQEKDKYFSEAEGPALLIV